MKHVATILFVLLAALAAVAQPGLPQLSSNVLARLASHGTNPYVQSSRVITVSAYPRGTYIWQASDLAHPHWSLAGQDQIKQTNPPAGSAFFVASNAMEVILNWSNAPGADAYEVGQSYDRYPNAVTHWMVGKTNSAVVFCQVGGNTFWAESMVSNGPLKDITSGNPVTLLSAPSNGAFLIAAQATIGITISNLPPTSTNTP